MRKRRSKSKSRKSSTRRRRRNGSKRSLFAAARASAMASRPKRRRKARKSAKRAKRARGKRVRPVIVISRSGRYSRPRRSKYFKKARMVNGRRRRVARRSNGASSIMKAVKSVLQVRTLTRYASLGGGIFAGTLFSRLLNTGVVPFTTMAIPASITVALAKARPLHGILHIILGSVIAAKSRNKYVQDAGVGLAALGGFDLVMQVASRLGVPGLPTFSGMNVELMGASYRPNGMISGMNIDLRGDTYGANYRGARYGMNVSKMGDARSSDARDEHLADNINDMLS